MSLRSILLVTGALALLLVPVQSSRASLHLHFEGFEDPGFTAGDGSSNNWNNNGGVISRVTSGTGGITSSSGIAHAVLATGAGGPYTRFGGYRSEFGPDGASGFTASLDIYLDPATIAAGTGFDYSVAASTQAGGHLRDFIFHVGNVGGDLLVNASNNTDFQFNDFKLNNENGGDNYTVSAAGWYTFEQDFYDNGSGELAVDFNLYDAGGTELYSVTRSNPADLIATIVGGNRYGWFTYNDIDGLAIDNTVLASVPEASAALVWSVLSLAFGSVVGSRRRRTA